MVTFGPGCCQQPWQGVQQWQDGDCWVDGFESSHEVTGVTLLAEVEDP